MFYYTLKDNKIEQFAEINGKAPSFMADWLKTEDKIIRLVDGDFAFEKDTDMQEQAKQKAEQERKQGIYEQIADYEQKLSATDYIASKIAEGVATKEEYAEKLTERQQWRDEINRLRALL